MTNGLEGSGDSGWKPTARQVGFTLLIAIIVLFAVFNLDKARIDFLVDSVRIPLIFVIAGTGLLAFLAGYLFAKHLDKND
jgi:uncharacterized integral membrane protein